MADLTKEHLHEVFEYRDGWLYWRPNPALGKRHVTLFAGKPAGTPKRRGAICLQLHGRFYYAHRLIFLMHHGYMPEFIDHIDMDAGNNRIENLRAATRAQNAFNRRVRSDSLSGAKNVSWSRKHRAWRVMLVGVDGARFSRSFETFEAADSVAKTLREQLHGEFCRE